ncbi:MAG TPA: flagellin [Thermoplasmata archaeon]|nr:MAG TPA: flagellin [Thermoplasmata archaeon]
MGIGAMIVFIAMVLVAGIAASVLIQTANRLEIQAMKTGQETIGEVSTGLGVTAITGYRAVENLSLMTIAIQPRSGSFTIDLAQTYIELSDSNKKVVLMYGAEFQDTTDINGNFFTAGFYDGLSSTTFGVIVLEDADGSLSAATPVINKGDQVMLSVNLNLVFDGVPSLGLTTRTEVSGLIQPEEGAPGVFAFTTPSSFAADNVFSLY